MIVLTLIAAAGATLFFVAYLILRFSRQIRGLSDAFIRLPSSQKAVLIVSVCIATVSAQKPGTNTVEDVSGTNGMDQVEVGGGGGQSNLLSCCVGPSGLDANLLSPPPPSTSTFDLSPEDAVRGYRLESVTTNAAVSYDMPTGAAVCGTWHLTGAYEDVMRVGNGDSGLGIGFPIGNHLCESLWAFTWGKVRPQLKNASNEIAAVGAPMSALPGVSRFWTAATSNETVLLTWENFAAGRVTNAEVDSLQADGNPLPRCLSAQIELFRNGDFITRSNEVERVYCRVNPDDWDDDGIENDIDLYPYHHIDGETHFGPHQEVPEGDDEDHYCWVEIVVHQANARVTFEGEGDSWLPDPSFIAEAGATNRVMILIGKRYAVHCTMPLECVGKSEADIETWHEDGVLMIEWPVWFEYVSVGPLLMASPRLGAGNGNGGTTIRVHPMCMGGGDYSWTDDFCCYSFAADGAPVFNCQGNCGCGGGCYTGEVTYECSGHQFSFGGFSCGCGSPDEEDPHGGEEEPQTAPAGPSISADFSYKAIVFEGAYTNAPGQVIGGRSTDSEVTCYAYGGTNGISYSFTIEGAEGKLRRIGGAQFPMTGTLGAGQSFLRRVKYTAYAPSTNVQDIIVHADYAENDTGAAENKEEKITAVQVKVEATASFPANKARHVFGPNEGYQINTIPNGYGQTTAFTPLDEGGFNVGLSIEDVSYSVNLSVIHPSSVVRGVFVRDMTSSDWTSCNMEQLTATVPGAGFVARWFLQPDYVSFSGIKVSEGTAQMSEVWGCFTNTADYPESIYSHALGFGAGEMVSVGFENEIGNGDYVGVQIGVPPSSAGGYTLVIPWSWGTGNTLYSYNFTTMRQSVSVTTEGITTIRKGNLFTIRGVNE